MNDKQTVPFSKTSTLLNGARLAERLGRAPAYVTAMRRAGYKFPYPGRTTLAHALAWLRACPEFVASHYLSKEWERLPKLPVATANRAALTGDKSR